VAECPHAPQPNYPYLVAAEDAARRIAAGEQQYRCPACRRWIWESYWPKREPAR
jgi:hypothetical protein